MGTEPKRRPAASSRLRYVCDDAPGIRRVRSGRGFRYVGPNGKAIRDARELARIRALAIPPAYEDVWICPNARGHMQATARDARGRKQYRYHALWQSFRSETKYSQLAAFGRDRQQIGLLRLLELEEGERLGGGGHGDLLRGGFRGFAVSNARTIARGAGPRHLRFKISSQAGTP